MRVGYLGGSFDPVHTAHLLIAESCLEQAHLDRVVFMVSGRPPHKLVRQLADPAHRLAMVRLAIKGNPALGVDDRELHRDGPSYTVDTVRELVAESPPGEEVVWIIGGDSLGELLTWRDAKGLVDAVEIVTAARPGYDAHADAKSLEAGLGADRVRRLTAGIIPMPLMEISSTDIRSRIDEGRSIRYLVPEAVEAYIRRHGLYR